MARRAGVHGINREATELRLRLHAIAHFGQRELRSIKPSVIQARIRGLQQKLAPTYVRTIFTNVSDGRGRAGVGGDEPVVDSGTEHRRVKARYAHTPPWEPPVLVDDELDLE